MSHLSSETKKYVYKPLLALALPLIFIQLCQASLGLVDTMVAGQYHYQDLAAVGLGSAMWTPVFILLTGIMFVLVPKVSHFTASGQQEEVLMVFQKGKKMALWLSLIGFVLVQLLAFSAPWLIENASVAKVAKNYLHYIALAIPAFVYTLLYRFMSEGSAQLMPIVKVFAVLLVTNTVLNLVLVFGIGPLTGLGGAGCGLATAISAYMALYMMRKLVTKAVPVIALTPKSSLEAQATKALFLEGLPIGISFVVEVLALTALAFCASFLGVKQVAAHQIAINIAMVAFMIPLALSSATTICIANSVGERDARLRKCIAQAAMIMALGYGLVVAVILLLWGQTFLLAFSQDKGTLLLATGLLIYVALFQLFDALQIVAAGILRGLQRFVSPLLILFVVYWLGVVPISYLVVTIQAFDFSGSIITIWMLLSAGIAIAAVILCGISFKQLSKGDAFTADALK